MNRVVKNVSDIPWSELALVLAVQREGSLRAAGKALQLSHPTVSRRIDELQASLGVRLVEREGRRLRLTLAGEDLAQTAARIEDEVHALGRRIIGRDHQLEGVVRVALSPSMFAALAPAIPRFRARHRRITLELVTGLRFANLTRREADIAIRLTNAPHDTLVGRRLSLFEGAAYIKKALYESPPEDERAPERLPWVDWDEAHAHHASARWMAENVPPGQVVARCESSMTMVQLVQAGVGAGFVPTMLAAQDSRLVRIANLPVFHRAVWVLTHADLRNVGRVRATLDWLHETLHVEGGGVWLGVATP